MAKTTKKGTKVTVTAGLRLTETIYADGDNVTVDCCEMDVISAQVEGYPGQIGYHIFTKPIFNSDTKESYYATIGKLGLNPENKQKVDNLIKEIEQHPAWVAKQTKIAKNIADIKKMEAARDASGYCRKCGGYCHGECEAN